jgi:hypothetical protein
MYRQGLGDCFLVTFNTGPSPVHMLVDCGTLGATTTGVRMRDVVADIAAETGSHLHLLVVTHEHKDHVSGFLSERAAFDAIAVDHVWVAWTEDPNDDLAKAIEKFTKDLLEAVSLAAPALAANQARNEDERAALHDIGAGMRALLTFVGDVPDGDAPLGADFAKTVNEAMSYASMKAGAFPEFLAPGRVIQPPWLPGIRFYVLGPPRSETAIAKLGDHDSPELYHLAARFGGALAGCTRFFGSPLAFRAYRETLGAVERATFEATLPFDARFRIEESDEVTRARDLAAYDDPREAWRRIDYDWLAAGDDLALQLDNATNNTSLALAIEIVEDGRVLLMPADAQLGNWLSWAALTFTVTDPNGATRTVTSADLLKRAVFYKVGHHASHNATINENGLELMQREDLVALIPVDRQVAMNKTPPWDMPATPLYRRLIEKTRGRVLRSDTGWPDADQRPETIPESEWNAVRAAADIVVEDLFIELRIA